MGGCQSDNSVRDSVQVKFTSALMKHDTSLTQQLLIDPSKSQIQLKMFEVPLVFGIQNTGWTCDGETFLVGGCMSNLNHPAKSIDVSAYFDIRSNIVFCNSCVNKLAKHDRNLLKTKWNGYFVHRAKKHTMEVDCLMMIRGFIRAYGVDDKGEFLLSGTYSQKTDRMFSAIKKYAGKQAITYNGIINERRDRIKGKWLMNDGATTNVTNEFKFQTKQIVDFSIPFKDIIPQQGNLKISQHKCELKGPFKEETKWACDGRTNFAQGCQSFITGFDQAQHVEKYKCSACDFDLCIECAKYSVYVDKIVEDHQKQSNGVWKANKKSKDKRYYIWVRRR
eukprot:403370363